MARATLLDLTDGALTALHPAPDARVAAVGPTIADLHNTLRPRIEPLGCWRMDDPRFDFDSSFIQPSAREDFSAIIALRNRHPDALTTLFGHADPSGADSYNEGLADRRAEAVYGLLTRRTDLWEGLYSRPEGGDVWGVPVQQRMLIETGFDCGKVDGVAGPMTSDAVKAFQDANGLKVDGVCGPLTRAALFRAYMDTLCQDASGPVVWTADQFLAGTGSKGDYQGCGERNPVRVLAAAELAAQSLTVKRDVDRFLSDIQAA